MSVSHDLAIGDRIRLIAMPDDPNPVPAGSEGTVTSVEKRVGFITVSQGQIGVSWDNGRSLSLIIGVDVWEKIQ